MNERYGQLSRIVIQGYMSIKECDLELNNINVLIGGNGAGKSNFMSIFELLQNTTEQNLQRYANKKVARTFFYNGPKITESVKVEFFFHNYSGIDQYPYVLELEMSGSNSLLLYEDPASFDGQVNEPNGRVTNASVIRSYLKNEWRKYHFHDTGLSSRIKSENYISNSVSLMDDARNLAAFLYRLKQAFPIEYKNILNAVHLVAPFFDDFILEPNDLNEEQISLRWRKNGCEDVFYASQFSDGTLRFICLATLLLQPAELQPATIIIDEPELGLHPFAIAVLAEMIQKAAVSKQVILATQSVELLDNFAVEDIIVVDSGENGSEFKRLDEEQLRLWLDDDYTLGELWNKNIFGGRP